MNTFLFQHQICHRDLKLENILLDEEGNAKVCLFLKYLQWYFHNRAPITFNFYLKKYTSIHDLTSTD